MIQEKAVSIGQNHEITQETQKAIEGDEDAKVHTVREKRKEHQKWKKQSSKKKEYRRRKPQSKGKNLECLHCGFKPNHARDNCPAMNEQCRICKKKGHFSTKCRNAETMHRVDEVNSDSDSDSSADYTHLIHTISAENTASDWWE